MKPEGQFMTKMTSFQYVEFYDVPRCIALRYRDKLFLLQSAFDESLDDYPSSYSIYILPDSVNMGVPQHYKNDLHRADSNRPSGV
jgi:hypothetical protein